MLTYPRWHGAIFSKLSLMKCMIQGCEGARSCVILIRAQQQQQQGQASTIMVSVCSHGSSSYGSSSIKKLSFVAHMEREQ
eukprot:1160517-Pelagomonas_calceolata.AAC.2